MRKEIKALAKSQIKGNLLMLILTGIVFGVVTNIVHAIPVIGTAAVIIFSPAVSLAYTGIYLGLASGHERVNIGDLFSNFRNTWISFKLSFFTGLFTFLWSLLLIIPGIIKSYAYMMSSYIIIENPEMGALDAITLSRRMMKGHKFEAFILDLSFIPWILLCIVTLGIGCLYVVPYMTATRANYYNHIKAAYYAGN